MAPMVYGGALTATGSPAVATVKSPIIPGEGGLVTLATRTLMLSPALTASCNGIVADPMLYTASVATKCQFWVVSITKVPVTLVKFVGPALSVR